MQLYLEKVKNQGPYPMLYPEQEISLRVRIKIQEKSSVRGEYPSKKRHLLQKQEEKVPQQALPIQILFFSIDTLKPKINSKDSFRGEILKQRPGKHLCLLRESQFRSSKGLCIVPLATQSNDLNCLFLLNLLNPLLNKNNRLKNMPLRAENRSTLFLKQGVVDLENFQMSFLFAQFQVRVRKLFL